eukprot:CAMPEP_0119005794 /NCGR_PEP_ID=MMETSP1176-20130426/1931_1 /TAXON_ID=265551 /ORGANISM="Synedropsis recta cf, Strain CCMP1620" /LENGTH=530 /DNA_ID=CAMNT_0006957639 /DNA_START=19 /DNA_END=1611 /DNA_ORIENTATION=-
MSYKNNTNANRDDLFGPPKAPSGPKHKRENAANRDALFGGVESKKKGGSKSSSSKGSSSSKTRPSSSSRPKPSTTSSAAASAPPAPTTTAKGYSREAKPKITSTLSGSAKISKLKEAEDFRDKATKAMQRGVFTRPDPVTAANYYKRAADAYGLCGENRLERLHRVASADCQMGNGSYSSAASEYMKAGALVRESDEDLERRRKEGWKFYNDAGKAWEKSGAPGKAANCQVLSALAWTWDDDSTLLTKQALTSLEESIEAHLPDILNEYALYRQTGVSKYVDPGNKNSKPSKETINMANEQRVKTAYAHEPIQEVTHALIHYGEYQSALYSSGAVSAMLEADGIATLTLSRNYVTETILALAMGDPVMAEQQFLNRHVQKTHYLTSRECKLAEDLFRAVLSRDVEGLDEARSPAGSNKNAMASLHASTRGLVQTLRISGAARRRVADPAKKIKKKAPVVAAAAASPDDSDDSSAEVKPPQDDDHDDDEEDDDVDPEKLDNELDDLMAGLDELDALGDSDDDLDDDDIDLR